MLGGSGEGSPPHGDFQILFPSTELSFFFSVAEEVIAHYKQLGYIIVCLEITQESITLEEFKIPNNAKILLLVGDENFGISAKVLKMADVCLHITMYGQNSSMNIAQATGIALYEITKKLSKNKKK